MKSRLRQKNDPKKKVKSKNKLVIIEEPVNVNSKFKNEAFNKLLGRNPEAKEKLNTIEYSEKPDMSDQRNSSTQKGIQSPRSRSTYKRENSYSNRNKLSSNSRKNYYENLSKSRKNLLEMVPGQDDPELYPTNVIRTKKVFRDPYTVNKYKEYPNQANYYNLNDNKNFNNSLRFKPDDVSNEQQSNISFNSDFKRDSKSEQPRNQNPNSTRNNNIKKVRIDDDNNKSIDNGNDDKEIIKIKRDSLKDRKSDTLENNGKKISPIITPYVSNEMKRENTDKNDVQDMIGDYINTNTDNNDNDVNRNNNPDDEFEKGLKEENANNNKNKKSNLTPSQFKVEEKEEPKKDNKDLFIIENINNFTIYKDENNDNKNKNTFAENLEQSPEEDFTIQGKEESKSNNDNDNNKDMENKAKENHFDNLDTIKCEEISYIFVKPKTKKNKVVSVDSDGKLSFNNDDEVLHYIKKKIREEKSSEYNNGKMKYNYFILTKKFHGKTLYEIGLENDLNEINNILRKENVEIEHEPVAFITIKELNQLKGGEVSEEIERLKKEIDKVNQEKEQLKEEIEKMNQENKKLQKDIDIVSFQNKKLSNKTSDENEKLKEDIEKMNKENEKLKKKLEIKNKSLEENSSLLNDYNKLVDEVEKLNEKNKEIENELNEKQNLIEEYEVKLKEKGNDKEKEKENDKDKENITDSKENEKLIEENKRLQSEREKFIKYINELQAYDEKVILEYQKVKSQLQIEIQKNNLNSNNPQNVKKYFTENELSIKSNEAINILTEPNDENKNKGKDKDKKAENVIDFMDSHEIISTKPEGKEEYTQTEEEEKNNNDYLYEEKKKSNRTSLNKNANSTKQPTIRQSREGKKMVKKDNNIKRPSVKHDKIIKDKKILKNEDYMDENKKKNKVGFRKEEESSLNDFMPKNKREESLKRAMKRIENKRKRDALNADKTKFRKSEKIKGMAGDLEKTLSKGDGKLYVDEEYEKEREQEEEENEDNNNY